MCNNHISEINFSCGVLKFPFLKWCSSTIKAGQASHPEVGNYYGSGALLPDLLDIVTFSTLPRFFLHSLKIEDTDKVFKVSSMLAVGIAGCSICPSHPSTSCCTKRSLFSSVSNSTTFCYSSSVTLEAVVALFSISFGQVFCNRKGVRPAHILALFRQNSLSQRIRLRSILQRY